MNRQSLTSVVLNERPLLRATERTISPAAANLMPAKSILLPVMSAVMPKALNPTLMSGNAQPQAIAAVRANATTQAGRWNMDVLVGSTLFFPFSVFQHFALYKATASCMIL